MEFLTLRVSSILIFFWETSVLFSILINSAQGFSFLCILVVLAICFIFDDSHSDKCEVVSNQGFDRHLSDNYCCWTSFHRSVGHLNLFFGKVSIKVLRSFLNWVVSIFWGWVVWVICIFLILTSYQIYYLQISSTIKWATFCFVLSIDYFPVQKLKFGVVSFFSFLL